MLVYIRAMRPSFLSVSALGCAIGFSIAFSQAGSLAWGPCLLALIIAVVGQGSANLINDLADAQNGSDAINTDRISPFTGGSRFIQNQLLSISQVRALALFTVGLVLIAGIGLLAALRAWELAWLGLLGLGIGWAYSAGPFKLMCRGLWGEVAIVLAWALVVVGSAMLSTLRISPIALLMGLAYGALVANILYANQIPDVTADRAVGKNTLAVITLPSRLWMHYAAFMAAGYGLLLAGVALGLLSPWTLLGLSGLPLSWGAMQRLARCRFDRDTMTAAIKATILAAHLFGLGVMLGFVLGSA